MARKKLTEEEKEKIKKEKLEKGLSENKSLISENISTNNKLEEMFKIFNENNLTPVDENKTPDTDKQRFIKYYNEKKKEKVENDLKSVEKLLENESALEKIKENNKKYEERQKENAIDAALYGLKDTGKNLVYGTYKGIADSGLGLLGILYNVPKTIKNLVTDPKNTSVIDDIFEENPISKTNEEALKDMQQLLNVEDAWESGNREDKATQFAGEFLLPLGKVKSGLMKVAKETNPTKLKRMESALNFVVPGPQVTKGASKGKQLLEIAGQTPVALAMEEAGSAFSDQNGILGNYTDKPKSDIEKITLINDKRKIGNNLFMEDLDPEVVRLIELDRAPEQKGWSFSAPFVDNENNINALGYVGLGAGAILTSSTIARQIKKVKDRNIQKVLQNNTLEDAIDDLSNKISDKSSDNLATNLNKEPSNIKNQMTTTERIDNSLADKMNFIDNMKKHGQLSEDTLYEVSRDIYSQIDSKFNSGILSENAKTRVSPLVTKQKIQQLKTNNIEQYTKLERLLEISSIIQDETNRVNKFKLNRVVDMSPDDYITARSSGKLQVEESVNYWNANNLLKLKNEHTELLKELRSIPQTATIIEEISDISQQMLKVLEDSKMYSQRSIDILKKNRTFNGLMSYKPRKEVINETLMQKVKKVLFNRQDNIIDNNNIIKTRTEGSISEGKNYLDLMEHDIKNTLLEIHYNNVTKSFVDDALPIQNKKLNKILDDNVASKEKTLTKGYLSKEEKLERLKNSDKYTLSSVNKAMKIRPLGVEDVDQLYTHDKPRSFFDIINRKQVTDDWLSNSLNETFGESEDKFLKVSKNFRNRDDVISYTLDGKIHYFQVDPIIAKGFNSNPELPGLIGRAIRSFKNFRQSTITGKLNPLFTVPSTQYTTEESIVALGKIADELNKSLGIQDISTKDYIREIGSAYNQIIAQNQSRNILTAFTEEYMKNFGKLDHMLDQKMFEVTQENLQKNLNKSLLTKIQLAGGASAKPFNVNSGVYYNLGRDATLSDALIRKIYKNNTLNNANKLVNIIDYTQTAMREAPNIGLVQYLGKTYGAIVDDDIVDPKKFDKILNVTNKYVANMGKKGSHLGLVGKIGKFGEDFTLYGHVAIQSLAPKIRGLRINENLDTINKTIKNLYDPNISYTEIFSNLNKQIKTTLDDKYVQRFVAASTIPTLMEYAWNYSSQENADAYHGISDYDKASKLILVNAFGKGNHLMLGYDQEIGVGHAITYNLLDSMLGMSSINQNDPAFRSNKLILSALSRSLFVDEIAGLDILGAITGTKININPLDERGGISELVRDRLNPDLTETAYENGIMNNYAINILETLFGTLGKVMTGAIEEGNVGSKVDVSTALSDSSQSVLSNLFNSGKIINNKFTTYNETSKYVYDKINTIQKLQNVSGSFNEKQNAVYELVKSYRLNRITPIHKQIAQLQKVKQHVKANGSVANEKLSLDFTQRKDKIQDIDKAIARLFALEYREYKDLDKIIEQEFGKGLNLENFVVELGE